MTAPPRLSPRETRIDPVCTRLFGVAELHAVHFQPKSDRGGMSNAVVIGVPEASRQMIRRALVLARRHRARVGFVCDTYAQAQQAYRLASRLLPDHRFVAMERADAGAWGMSS